jgi:hypothetical protein
MSKHVTLESKLHQLEIVERENIVHSAFIFFSGMLTLDP